MPNGLYKYFDQNNYDWEDKSSNLVISFTKGVKMVYDNSQSF